MWRRKLYRLLQIIESVIDKLLKIVWSIIIKGLRITHQPRFRHPLLISVSVMGITAIIALSVIGLFNYTPDTSPSFPYIQPPGGEGQKYYFETTVNDLGAMFFQHTLQSEQALSRALYLENSFIIKNFLIRDYELEGLHETYFMYNSVKFIPRDLLELQELKAGDVIDITGFCGSLDEKNGVVIMGNCQFLPAGLIPLPLPGGPAPIGGGY